MPIEYGIEENSTLSNFKIKLKKFAKKSYYLEVFIRKKTAIQNSN